MSIEEVVYWYAGLLCVLLVPFVWLLIRRKREKSATLHADNPAVRAEHKTFDWSILLALRPHTALSGEMWLKAFVAAFIALSVGVIIVLYIFPLGAAWAASAAFIAVSVMVGLTFILLD